MFPAQVVGKCSLMLFGLALSHRWIGGPRDGVSGVSSRLPSIASGQAVSVTDVFLRHVRIICYCCDTSSEVPDVQNAMTAAFRACAVTDQ